MQKNTLTFWLKIWTIKGVSKLTWFFYKVVILPPVPRRFFNSLLRHQYSHYKNILTCILRLNLLCVTNQAIFLKQYLLCSTTTIPKHGFENVYWHAVDRCYQNQTVSICQTGLHPVFENGNGRKNADIIDLHKEEPQFFVDNVPSCMNKARLCLPECD
jgi:hypothetical protein